MPRAILMDGGHLRMEMGSGVMANFTARQLNLTSLPLEILKKTPFPPSSPSLLPFRPRLPSRTRYSTSFFPSSYPLFRDKTFVIAF